MTDATGTLVRFALDLEIARLHPSVITAARTVLADTVGVTFAASRHAAMQAALGAISFPGGGSCTVIGFGSGASPGDAAMVNGIGAHDLELDDAHPMGPGHAAAVIVPATLAAAEERGDATVGDLLIAIIAGYDVQARVMQAMGHARLHERGFHPTSVCGTIGSAIAAGRLFGLSVDQMRSAMGLAASQSSGLLSYREDPSHMGKSFQTGMASRNGLTAARFARAGYRAAPDALGGRHGILSPFVGDDADPERLTADLGTRFEITGTSLKRHASCSLTHAAVDALVMMLEEAGIATESIDAIDVQLAHHAVARIDGHRLWTHNIQYVMALAAHERRIGPEHFSEDWTQNESISALAERVTVHGSDQLSERHPKGAIVSVSRSDGTRTRQCDEPRGGPTQPLTHEELRDKFVHLSAPVAGPDAAASLWDTILLGDFADPAEGLLRMIAIGPESAKLAAP